MTAKPMVAWRVVPYGRKAMGQAVGLGSAPSQGLARAYSFVRRSFALGRLKKLKFPTTPGRSPGV